MPDTDSSKASKSQKTNSSSRSAETATDAVLTEARQRLDQVMTESDRALQDPFSAETVHDLRVSIRRLRAFLDEYADLSPKKAARRASSRLKKAFKLAGQARDFDIALEQAMGQGMRPNTRVVRMLKQLRKKSTDRLLRHLADSSGDPFRLKDLKLEVKGSVKKKRKAASSRPRSLEASNGHPVWVNKALLKAGRRLLNRNGSGRQFHKLRLRVKKRRYLLETLQPPKREVTRGIKVLKQLQEELGAINDYRTTIELLKSSQLVNLPRSSELVEKLRGLESQQAEAFRKTWGARFSKWS